MLSAEINGDLSCVRVFFYAPQPFIHHSPEKRFLFERQRVSGTIQYGKFAGSFQKVKSAG
jgi:hypothetical protein